MLIVRYTDEDATEVSYDSWEGFRDGETDGDGLLLGRVEKAWIDTMPIADYDIFELQARIDELFRDETYDERKEHGTHG